MQDIEVSIVIPTHNRKSLLKETLVSLFEQTYSKKKYEIIVCDDNSNDGTDEMMRKLMFEMQHNLRYVKVESDTKGAANARNTGIKNSIGSIIGFTDDDCIVSKDWIERAVKCFEAHKDICGTYGSVITVDDCNSDMLKIPRKVNILEDDGSYVTSNIFYKKDVLLKVGYFDVEQKYLEDIELGWRVENVGKIHFDSDRLVNHKISYLSLIQYIKRLKVVEYQVLMCSKHPEHVKKNKLMFKHIYNKRVFYVIFFVCSIFFYPLHHYFAYLLLICTMIAYFWARVVIDNKLTKYPLRIISFPGYFIPDFIRFIHSLKASLKYRYLIIF